ncbi:alpha/beta fold hydrolase [Allokutzneria sp. NRRL B-24872]|uniref:alpha/beta fold hydrolase n=1 Tax=Allokutzneria sp. NRRL B-24872 TaxID=1137961 RepID=UPI000A35F9EB|nr:alpha/beta fold hydrolase [Allokutzneria sp. NRRL B-24872]
MSPLSRSRVAAVLTLLLALFAAPVTASAGPVPIPSADPFYQPPEPLPAGKPGEIIRSRKIVAKFALLPAPVQAWQILYRSTSATVQPIAVSGTLLVPPTPWLAGPRPLLSYAVGTHGLGDVCAPSFTIRTGIENEVALIAQPLLKGWAVVITDYQGLGTPGVHTYAVGQAEGRSVLDAARAAQRIIGSGPVGLWGFSQGGQASAFAGELHPSYAPELNVVGVAAGGVPRDLAELAPVMNGGPFFGLAVGVMAGYKAAYPELPYETLLNAHGRRLVEETSKDCVAVMVPRNAFQSFATIASVPDPLADPQWQARLAENRAGQKAPRAPVYLVHGDVDPLIPHHIAKPLLNSYCSLGARVQWRTIPLAGHITGDVVATPLAMEWLSARFAGRPATTSC